VNLALVPIGELTGNAANEQAAVELRRMADGFHLQDKIAELFFGFQRAAARAGDVDFAFVIHGEGALAFGMVFPAGQVLAVEERRQAERLELDVFELALAGVELQADVTAAHWLGIGVFEDRFAVELDGGFGAVESHLV